MPQSRSETAQRRPQPWRIRSYRPGDHSRVVRLWRTSGIHVGPSDSMGELERSRRRDPGLFLVAEHGTKIVGAVLGRFDGRRGWINHLAVDPEVRRLGLGSELVARVEGRLRHKGCVKVNLHIEPNNRGVGTFYGRIGYQKRNLLFMEKWIIRRRTTSGPRSSQRARSRTR